METVRRSLLGSCFSDQTISILCLAHKPSTTSQYQSVWSLFLNFLADRGLTSLDMTEVSCVGIVCDFLAYHSSLGKQYRTIASYRSALRHPILFTCGVDIRSEASDLFMRGLFNFHPPVRSRPMPLWSLASLLDFLCGPPFEPLESASFRALVRKTLCLLLLATGRRIGEIAHLSRLYKPSASSISLHLVPGFTPKHHTQTFQSSKPSIAYLDSDKSLSHLLCPVRAYFIYQRKSSLWANSLAPALRHHFLWSSPNSPLPVSKGSLTSHFIALVHDCRRREGHPTDIPVGPHQMRRFAASYSTHVGHGEDKIKRVMGFSSVRILRKHYVGDVGPLRVPCVLPGGAFLPKSHELSSSDTD